MARFPGRALSVLSRREGDSKTRMAAKARLRGAEGESGDDVGRRERESGDEVERKARRAGLR